MSGAGGTVSIDTNSIPQREQHSQELAFALRLQQVCSMSGDTRQFERHIAVRVAGDTRRNVMSSRGVEKWVQLVRRRRLGAVFLPLQWRPFRPACLCSPVLATR